MDEYYCILIEIAVYSSVHVSGRVVDGSFRYGSGMSYSILVVLSPLMQYWSGDKLKLFFAVDERLASLS